MASAKRLFPRLLVFLYATASLMRSGAAAFLWIDQEVRPVAVQVIAGLVVAASLLFTIAMFHAVCFPSERRSP